MALLVFSALVTASLIDAVLYPAAAKTAPVGVGYLDVDEPAAVPARPGPARTSALVVVETAPVGVGYLDVDEPAAAPARPEPARTSAPAGVETAPVGVGYLDV
jgi:hypothetical protein